MDNQPTLAEKLIAARKRRGLTVYRAAKLMPDVWPNTLRTLEGSGQFPPADGKEIKLKTAVSIVQAYYPEINLTDFMPDSRPLVRFCARKGRYSVRLRRLSQDQIAS